MREYRHPTQRGCSLCSLLRCALRDQYTRNRKDIRNYPSKSPYDPQPRAPEILILKATPTEVPYDHMIRYVLSKGVAV